MRKLNQAVAVALITSFVGMNVSLAAPVQNQNVQPAINVQPVQQLPQLPEMGAYTPGQPLKGQVSIVPAGTSFQIATNSTVSSTTSQLGEIFTATITDPIIINNGVVIPTGSEAIGQVTYIDQAGRAGKNAVMELKITNIKLPNGQRIPVLAKIATTDKSGKFKGGSVKGQIAKSVAGLTTITAGGTIAGLGVGGIVGAFGGGAGAVGGGTLLGLTAGGLGAVAWTLGRKGKDVTVPTGTRMFVTLEQPVTIGQ